MREPTRAMVLSPLHYAWCLDKLLQEGHDRETAERCLKLGDWSKLPLSQGELDRYTCTKCGKPPYKDAGGRLQIGCWGTCTQKAFAELREDVVQERARNAAHAIASEKVEPAITVRRQRGLWMDTD